MSGFSMYIELLVGRQAVSPCPAVRVALVAPSFVWIHDQMLGITRSILSFVAGRLARPYHGLDRWLAGVNPGAPMRFRV